MVNISLPVFRNSNLDSCHEKVLLLGDFIAEENEGCQGIFLFPDDLKNYVKETMC